jgi:hypothetical protein
VRDRADDENLSRSLPAHPFRLDLDNNKVYVTELDLDESGAYLGEHVEREIPEGVRIPEVRLASVSQNMQDDVLLMAHEPDGQKHPLAFPTPFSSRSGGRNGIQPWSRA